MTTSHCSWTIQLTQFHRQPTLTPQCSSDPCWSHTSASPSTNWTSDNQRCPGRASNIQSSTGRLDWHSLHLDHQLTVFRPELWWTQQIFQDFHLTWNRLHKLSDTQELGRYSSLYRMSTDIAVLPTHSWNGKFRVHTLVIYSTPVQLPTWCSTCTRQLIRLINRNDIDSFNYYGVYQLMFFMSRIVASLVWIITK